MRRCGGGDGGVWLGVGAWMGFPIGGSVVFG